MPELDSDPPVIPSPEGCAALIITLIQDPRVRNVVAPLAAQAARRERTLAALLGEEPSVTDLEDIGAASLASPGRRPAPPPRWPLSTRNFLRLHGPADSPGGDGVDVNAASPLRRL
jgi:hypothetical protein